MNIINVDSTYAGTLSSPLINIVNSKILMLTLRIYYFAIFHNSFIGILCFEAVVINSYPWQTTRLITQL